MVEVDSRPCERDVGEVMGAYAARTGIVPNKTQAAELLIRRIATQGLEDLGAFRGDQRAVHTDTARVTDLPDCHAVRDTAHVTQDDSPGYDIDLDGLRGSVASRSMIADWANVIAHDSRYGSSAPPLHEGSSKGALLNWHRWNDRNGEWTDDLTEDDLWALLRDYYDEEHGAADTAAADDNGPGYDIDLDGLAGSGTFDASDFFEDADMREASPEALARDRCVRVLAALQVGQTLYIDRTAWRVEASNGLTVYITKGKGKKLYTLVTVGFEPCTFDVSEVWPGSGQLKEGVAPVATWVP
jgi:hypothetical protein